MSPVTRKRPAPKPGIVHLGLGAFSRSHFSIYTEDAVAKSGGDWGVIGVSMRSSRVRDDLIGQHYAYTALQLNPHEATARRVEVISDMLVACENPKAVLIQMADPEIKIVSLTVTEKGYCLSPSTGELDLRHSEITQDLRNPLPCSAPGFLVRALDMRRCAGLAPFTVLSCDNLPENGRVIRRVVLELARRINPDLHVWIEKHVRFPSTMVDRITPATTDADREKVRALTGYHDASPVVHEPFSQWVIEDKFVNDEHPDWSSAGADLVADVRPYENMKLRMLNATHSALAYLGYLAGFETISDTVADKDFEAYTQNLWHTEIIPTLVAPPGVSLTDYADELMHRYMNPSVRHLTWQIAMDGSQKLPQRVFGTLTDRLGKGQQASGLLLVVAAWMRYVSGVDELGQTIEVRDPLADKFAALAAAISDPEEWVTELLGIRAVFSDEFSRQLAEPVSQAYCQLVENGAHAMVRNIARKSMI